MTNPYGKPTSKGVIQALRCMYFKNLMLKAQAEIFANLAPPVLVGFGAVSFDKFFRYTRMGEKLTNNLNKEFAEWKKHHTEKLDQIYKETYEQPKKPEPTPVRLVHDDFGRLLW